MKQNEEDKGNVSARKPSKVVIGGSPTITEGSEEINPRGTEGYNY